MQNLSEYGKHNNNWYKTVAFGLSQSDFEPVLIRAFINLPWLILKMILNYIKGHLLVLLGMQSLDEDLFLQWLLFYQVYGSYMLSESHQLSFTLRNIEISMIVFFQVSWKQQD